MARQMAILVDMTVSQPVALITGAARGVGRAITLALAEEGWAAGLLALNEDGLDAVAKEVSDAGGRAGAMSADVTDRGALDRAVAAVTDQLGPIDLLVSNAGLREQTPAAPWQADPDDWWRVVEVNLRGPFLLVQAVVPAMVERGSGRVLHINSSMAGKPQPLWSAYGVSKAGVSRLTDSLAAALHGTGVTVIEVSPGLVRTDMTETMWGPPEQQKWNPIERITGTVVRFARGDLDALHGRFVSAPKDDLDALLAAADTIRAADARTLRFRPYADTDPLR